MSRLRKEKLGLKPVYERTFNGLSVNQYSEISLQTHVKALKREFSR
jgi:hypothetical protein